MNSFGKVAIQLGYITQEQLDESIRAQSAAAKAGLRKRLGEILIRKGYLTQEQFQRVLKGQTVNRKRVGQYELLSKLGEGGMGAVFKARQVYMDRDVALKILSPKMAKKKDFLRRFVREARAVAKLNHPHIVAGIDVGSADGYCYFAMEYIDGETLGEFTHRTGGKLQEKMALNFIHQTALALQHAHEASLLHRDVKPDNILLDKEHKIAKLADLGLVRSAESRDDDAALTQAGQAVGTPFYISPEQARGICDLTPATDTYSLGASLYHLTTGEVPYDGQTAAVIMTRHITDPVPSPRKVNPKLSIGVDKLVQRAMQKNPEDRFRSMVEFADAIQSVMESGDYSDTRGDDEMPMQPRKRTAAVRPEEPDPVLEKDLEIDEEAAAANEDSRPGREPSRQLTNTASYSATRGRRRKQRNDIFSLVLALVIVAICGAVLYVWNPFKPQPETPKQAVGPTQPAVPLMKTAMPASLKPDPAGGRAFVASFEKPLAYFDVDPLLYNGSLPEPFKDGQSLSMAQVRSGDSGLNIRLVLPSDLKVSPNITLSFMICLTPAAGSDVTPEIQVWWDNLQESMPKRALSGWVISEPKCKGAWAEIKLCLKTAQYVLASNQSAEGPQYISISAGKPKEKFAGYVAKFELHETPSGGAATPQKVKAPDSEAPVAPRRSPDAAPRSDPAPVGPKKIDKPASDDADALKKAL